MRLLEGTEVLFVWCVSSIYLNQMAQWETIPAGCLKRLPSKAAGESKPEAYPLGRTVRRIRSTTSVRAAEW